ncbi:hypothetical protein LR066_04870 [candidate division WOR-3 bacterium]|nr:hypothetical protein [candidate division WOR-3 bacterium]
MWERPPACPASMHRCDDLDHRHQEMPPTPEEFCGQGQALSLHSEPMT